VCCRRCGAECVRNGKRDVILGTVPFVNSIQQACTRLHFYQSLAELPVAAASFSQQRTACRQRTRRPAATVRTTARRDRDASPFPLPPACGSTFGMLCAAQALKHPVQQACAELERQAAALQASISAAEADLALVHPALAEMLAVNAEKENQLRHAPMFAKRNRFQSARM